MMMTEVLDADRELYNPKMDGIPPHMHGGIMRYVVHGVPPGHFLHAVLSNDLKEAFARCDAENEAAMKAWVRFMRFETPSPAQGSPEKVAAWIGRGGLRGLRG